MRFFYKKFKFFIFFFPNKWDIFFLCFFFIIFFLIFLTVKEMFVSYEIGMRIDVNLSFIYIPLYTIKTTSRMFIAFLFSLIFALVFGTLAAKNSFAEKIIIPLIDVLQSIPILGFFSFSIIFFMEIFPNSFFAIECVAIFAIFTSQVWNMIFSFYQ